MSEKLTEVQIKNWREALVPTFGMYALIMPAEKVQELRDKMSEKANQVREPEEEK